MSLPTIESSYAIHATRAFVGFDHPDSAALQIALEVLDGTESFLWVSRLLMPLDESGADMNARLTLRRNISAERAWHMAPIWV